MGRQSIEHFAEGQRPLGVEASQARAPDDLSASAVPHRVHRFVAMVEAPLPLLAVSSTLLAASAALQTSAAPLVAAAAAMSRAGLSGRTRGCSGGYERRSS